MYNSFLQSETLHFRQTLALCVADLSLFQELGVCDLGWESLIVLVMWDAFDTTQRKCECFFGSFNAKKF